MANRTFGIELECFYPESADMDAAMRAVAPVMDEDYYSSSRRSAAYSRWCLKSDCTIRPPRANRAAEITSPVLTGMEGVKQVGRMTRAIAEMGAGVNKSTGGHVHIGSNGFSGNDSVQNLVDILIKYEPAFFALGGGSYKSRQESGFCSPWLGEPIFDVRDENEYHGWKYGKRGERYMSLNLTNWGHGYEKDTFEFRCFAGTVNALKAQASILMAHSLVEYASRNSNWSTPVCSNRENPVVVMNEFIDVFFHPDYLPEGGRVSNLVMNKMRSQAEKALAVA